MCVVLALLLFAVCVVLLCNVVVMAVSAGRVLSDFGVLPHNEAALLLGAPPLRNDGARNLFFVYRVQAAASLLGSGKVDKIILSGDAAETEAMLSSFERMGVPRCSLLVDNDASRTVDSIASVRAKFGFGGFTVVSQRFHNRRAVFLARCMGLDVVAFNAQDVRRQRWLLVLAREILSRTFACLDAVRICSLRCAKAC